MLLGCLVLLLLTIAGWLGLFVWALAIVWICLLILAFVFCLVCFDFGLLVTIALIWLRFKGLRCDNWFEVCVSLCFCWCYVNLLLMLICDWGFNWSLLVWFCYLVLDVTARGFCLPICFLFVGVSVIFGLQVGCLWLCDAQVGVDWVSNGWLMCIKIVWLFTQWFVRFSCAVIDRGF